MSRLSKIGRRRARAILLAGRALWVFVVVELGLKTMRLPRLCALLGVGFTSAAPASAGPARGLPHAHVRSTAEAVDRVAVRWPWGDTCLRRSLVLGSMLREAQPVLVLGVRRTADAAIVAHSWLEVDGHPVDSEASRYTVLSVP